MSAEKNPKRTYHKRTYVVLRPEATKAVKIAAAERGTTMQQIVVEAIEKYLKARKTGAGSDNVHFVNSPASHP